MCGYNDCRSHPCSHPSCKFKEWRHSFAKREINDQEVWELVTKRRMDGLQDIIESQWPLLPVFELLAPIRPPRFKPFVQLDNAMVSRNL